jgi:hypothetical protein
LLGKIFRNSGSPAYLVLIFQMVRMKPFGHSGDVLGAEFIHDFPAKELVLILDLSFAVLIITPQQLYEPKLFIG